MVEDIPYTSCILNMLIEAILAYQCLQNQCVLLRSIMPFASASLRVTPRKFTALKNGVPPALRYIGSVIEIGYSEFAP